MNITFLLRPWPVHGGGETVTIALANEFVRRGHNVFVLYTHLESKKEIPFINSAITAKKVDGVTFDEHTKNVSAKDIITANSFLKGHINSVSTDIVINQWWPIETLAGIKELCKVIHCLHMAPFKACEYENKRWKGKDIIAKLLGRKFYYFYTKRKSFSKIDKALPYVDCYLFLAESFAKEYIHFSKFKKPYPILDYCNNPLPFDESIDSKEFDKKENIVLFVGRMYEGHKKVSKIIYTWHKIEDSQKFNNWKLVLVGDGPDRPQYEELAAKLNLRNYEFVGFRQPAPYYKKAKVFLMTSTHEGWPMTLLESQQNGVVPIVRDTFSSVHDIISDGVNGRIIPPYDDSAYIEAVSEVMSDETKRNEMARNAILSCQKFSIKNVVDKWEHLFETLLEK